jgi:hypothetical protein
MCNRYQIELYPHVRVEGALSIEKHANEFGMKKYHSSAGSALPRYAIAAAG